MEQWNRLLTISGSLLLTGILTAVILGLVGVLVWYFSSIFIYLLVAVILALIGRPVLNLLGKIKIRNRKLPSSLTAILTLLVLYGAFLGIISFFVPIVINISSQVSSIEASTIESQLKEPLTQFKQLNSQYNFIEVPEESTLEEQILIQIQHLIEEVNITNLISGILGFGANFMIGLFSVTFIAFYFLQDRTLLSGIVMTLTPDGYMDRVKKVLDNVKGLLTRYFIGVLLEILLVGGLVSLGLGIIGVKDALFIGYFAGIFNVIPYLGPIIGGTMTATMTVLNSLYLDFYTETLPMTAKALGIFVIVQLIDNFIFQPLIYSSSVKAHPLEVFIVIIMAGYIGGPAAMIVAIPVYTIIRVVAREFFSQFKVVQSLTGSLD